MKKFLRVLLIILAVLVLATAGLSYYIYAQNFDQRYTTYAPSNLAFEDFPGLQRQAHPFSSNKGQKLSAYTYFHDSATPKGLVVFSHGYGGGGHRSYLAEIDYFAAHGYWVFAYDATGNDESEGKVVGGLPQGILDLDYALRYIAQTPSLKDLPIGLFGHSWGAYSAGSVLALHPEARAAVLAAGFDSSLDMFEIEGHRLIGGGIQLMLPFISLIDRLRFGQVVGMSISQGVSASKARVLFIQSRDDEMIPFQDSQARFEARFANDPRVSFISLDGRGHNYIFNSDQARAYRETFNQDFKAYTDALPGGFTPEIKTEYLNTHLDKHALQALDPALMQALLAFYDQALTSN